jgi:hypothetical protein
MRCDISKSKLNQSRVGWWSAIIALPQFAGLFGGGKLSTPIGTFRVISTTEQSISTAFPYVFQLVSPNRCSSDPSPPKCFA